MLNDEASGENEAEKEADKVAYGMAVLLKKFNIDHKDKLCWFLLALELARMHEANWPNVKATRGAPKGARTIAGELRNAQIGEINRLVQACLKKKKKPGRPTVLKFHPIWIDDIKAEHKLSGHGSDKEAIEIFVDKNLAVTPAERKGEIKYIQKRLSEGRRKIPKTSI